MPKLSALGALAAATLFIAAMPARADSEYEACIANSPEVEFAVCGANWVEREDARLNAAWREVLPLLEARERERLVAEQRAWIRFKDGACEYFYTDYWGTVGRNTWYPRCVADIVIARTVQLRDIKARIDSQNE